MDKINKFAELVERETMENFKYDYPGWERHCKVTVIRGRKYTKVDVGASGKYMVDADGNIYGIKSYGSVNKKKRYGTLDTVDQYFWGGYSAVGKS